MNKREMIGEIEIIRLIFRVENQIEMKSYLSAFLKANLTSWSHSVSADLDSDENS